MSDINLARLIVTLRELKTRAEMKVPLNDSDMERTFKLLERLGTAIHGRVRTQSLKDMDDAIVVARYTYTCALAAKNWPRFVHVNIMLVRILGQQERFLQSDADLKEIEY